jgi:ApbE superfamily uncharacterized protein (UPF0280 family)
MSRLRVAWLPDGKRLHLSQGRVDLIMQAFGDPAEVGRAYDAGIARARGLPEELADDVALLQAGLAPRGAVGLRAVAACGMVEGALGPVTALTGAVADEVLAAMVAGGRLERGFVNARGAVAFHLAEGQGLSPHAMDWPAHARYENTTVRVPSTARTRAIAAAGWHFHRHAFGYVDQLYTAATSSAVAEALLGSISAQMAPPGAPGVPVYTLEPDSLFGRLPAYAPMHDLAEEQIRTAIARGQATAAAAYSAGTATLVLAALRDETFFVAPPQFNLRSLWSVQL